MAESRPKKTIHPNQLAALQRHKRGNPQNLKRGGKQPKAFLSPEELLFCQLIADGASRIDAARWANLSGNPSQHAYDLLKRPLAQKTVEEFAAARKQQSIELASVRREERSIFIHQELIHRLRTAQTHERIGDLAIAKMLEVAFRATGEIQPTRNIATATAGAVASSESKALYVPVWRQMQGVNPAQTIEGETLESVPRLEPSKPSAT